MRLAVAIAALWVLFNSAAASPLALANAVPTKGLSRRSPPRDPLPGDRNSRQWKVSINLPYGRQRMLYRGCLKFWDYYVKEADVSSRPSYQDLEEICQRSYPVLAQHRVLSEEAPRSADPVLGDENDGLSPDTRPGRAGGEDESADGPRLFQSRRPPPADTERRAGFTVPSRNDIMTYLRGSVGRYLDPKQGRPPSAPSGPSGMLNMQRLAMPRGR